MVNVSIITKCNNNCKYCFQEGDYHERNQILSYEDVEHILEWSKGDGRIALFGGEPTLHPDIVRIVGRCLKDRPTILFSNILGPSEIIEEILIKYPNAGWLVNTTTRDELKDLFEKNIKLFQKHKIPIAAGITLTLDKEQDSKYINNLVKIGSQYSDIVNKYRIAQATPYDGGHINLTSFKEPIEEFCKLAEQKTPWISTGLDCATNYCQISESDIDYLRKRYVLRQIELSDNCHAIFVILADKTIEYCSSVPPGIVPKKYYTEFKNYIECSDYLNQIKESFMKKYQFLCKNLNRNCSSNTCLGACFAINAHIKQYLEQQKNKK